MRLLAYLLLLFPGVLLAQQTEETKLHEIQIQGGSEGEILATDGSGNSYWAELSDLPGWGNRYANIMEFGAIPDDATADDAAFSSAIATGLPIYVPGGVFEITQTVSLDPGQIIFGSGDASIIRKLDGEDALFSIIELGTNASVASLKIDGNKDNEVPTGSTRTTGISVSQDSNFTVTDVTVTDVSRHGILVSQSGFGTISNFQCYEQNRYAISFKRSAYNTVTNLIVRRTSGAERVMVEIADSTHNVSLTNFSLYGERPGINITDHSTDEECNNIAISNGVVEGLGLGLGGQGLSINGGNGNIHQNISYSNILLRNLGDASAFERAIEIANAKNIRFSNITVHTSEAPLYQEDTGSQIHFDGLTIVDCTGDTRLNSCTDCSITGLDLEGTNRLSILGGTGIHLTNSNIRTTYTNAIEISGADEVYLIDNILESSGSEISNTIGYNLIERGNIFKSKINNEVNYNNSENYFQQDLYYSWMRRQYNSGNSATTVYKLSLGSPVDFWGKVRLTYDFYDLSGGSDDAYGQYIVEYDRSGLSSPSINQKRVIKADWQSYNSAPEGSVFISDLQESSGELFIEIKPLDAIGAIYHTMKIELIGFGRNDDPSETFNGFEPALSVVTNAAYDAFTSDDRTAEDISGGIHEYVDHATAYAARGNYERYKLTDDATLYARFPGSAPTSIGDSDEQQHSFDNETRTLSLTGAPTEDISLPIANVATLQSYAEGGDIEGTLNLRETGNGWSTASFNPNQYPIYYQFNSIANTYPLIGFGNIGTTSRSFSLVNYEVTGGSNFFGDLIFYNKRTGGATDASTEALRLGSGVATLFESGTGYTVNLPNTLGVHGGTSDAFLSLINDDRSTWRFLNDYADSPANGSFRITETQGSMEFLEVEPAGNFYFPTLSGKAALVGMGSHTLLAINSTTGEVDRISQNDLGISGAADGVTTAGIVDDVNDEIDFTVSGASDFSVVITKLLLEDEIFGAAALTATELADNAVTMPKIDQAGATDGQVIAWNNTAGDWEPTTLATNEPSDGDKGDITVSTGGLNWTIDEGAVGATEIATAGVGAAEIATNAVGSSEIAADAVTMAKIDQAGATTGQVIKWNGTDWAPAADDTGGGGVSDGDKGDITVSSSGATWTIDDDFVPVFQGFIARSDDDQSIASGSFTEVNNFGEDEDPNSWFDASTGRFQPDVAGVYQINGGIIINNSTDGTRLVLNLYLNGAFHVNLGRVVMRDTGSTNNAGITGSAMIRLNGTTDYVSLFFFQDSGTNQTIGPANPTFTGNGSFSANLVGN